MQTSLKKTPDSEENMKVARERVLRKKYLTYNLNKFKCITLTKCLKNRNGENSSIS